MQIKPLIESFAQPNDPIKPTAWRTIPANDIQQSRSESDLCKRQILESVYHQLELKLKQITNYGTPSRFVGFHDIALSLSHISFPGNHFRTLSQRSTQPCCPADRAQYAPFCLYDGRPLTVSGYSDSGPALENVAEIRAKQMNRCLAGSGSCVHNGINDVVSTVFLVPGRVA